MLTAPETDRRDSVARSTGISGASGLIYAGLQAVALVLVTRLAGAEAAGRYLLAQAVATPIAITAGLRLRDRLAVETSISAYRPHRSRLLTVDAFVLAAFAAITVLVVGRTQFAAVLILVLLSNQAQYVSYAAHGRMFRHREFRWPAGSTIAFGVTNAAALTVGLVVGDLVHGVAIAAAAWALIALADNLRVASFGSERNTSTDAGSILDGLRLGFTESVGVIQISGVRTVVWAIVGSAALTVFGVTSAVLRFLLPFVQALGRVISPELAENIASKKLEPITRYTRRCFGVAALATPLVAGGFAVFGPTVVAAAFGDEVRPGWQLCFMLGLAAGPMFLAILQVPVLLAFGRKSTIEQASVTSSVLAVSLAVPLVPLFSLTGAAVALLVGNLVRATVQERSIRTLLATSG